MTEQVTADTAFLACTGHLTNVLKVLTLLDTYKQYRQKYDFQMFQKKMVDHKMERYSEQLYLFMIFKCKQLDHHQKNNSRFAELSRRQLESHEEIVLLLKELLSGGQIHMAITSISRSRPINDKKIRAILNHSIIEALSDEIQMLRLDQFPITKEEAEAEINSHTDIKWIKEWMESYGVIDRDFQSFTLHDFDGYVDKIGFSHSEDAKSKARDNLISEYAYDHPEIVNLDVVGLDRILERIRAAKPKTGRRQETAEIKELALTLSSLVRIDRYIENKEEIKITNIVLKNSDCRFIHDVLAFFGFIIDYNKDPKNAKNLEKRLRKMVADVDDPAGIEDLNERMFFFRLDCQPAN